MIKLAILSISLLTVMSGAAVAPAIAEIIAAFPGASTMLGKMVLTTPALTIIPVALLTGVLNTRVSRKKLLFSGILLYIVGGFGGGLANSIPFLLTMRAVLGIGVGILMPLSTGIIADLYSGEEKTKTMGFSTAATNLGAIIATLLAGILASYHWRASFFIYLLGIPVLFLVSRYIPDHARSGKKGSSQAGPSSRDVAGYVMWGMGMFLAMVAFYTIPVNIALYISEYSMGGSKAAGVAMAVMTASSFVTGLMFGRLNTIFGKWLKVIGMTGFAASFFLLSAFPFLVAILGSLILSGFSFGILVPLIMNGVTGKNKKNSGTAATSVVSSFLFAGQFASPVITGKLALLTTGPGIGNIFLMLSFAIGVVAVAGLISAVINPKKHIVRR